MIDMAAAAHIVTGVVQRRPALIRQAGALLAQQKVRGTLLAACQGSGCAPTYTCLRTCMVLLFKRRCSGALLLSRAHLTAHLVRLHDSISFGDPGSSAAPCLSLVFHKC